MSDVEQCPWLRCDEGVSGCLLVCFPHAGGSAAAFNGWRRAAPGGLNIARVQLPGREDLAAFPLQTEVSGLVPRLADELEAIGSSRFAFYGHSMGAIVAYELTRELRRRNTVLPSALFVSGRRAPHLPLSHPPLYTMTDEQLLAQMVDMGAPASAVFTAPHWRAAYFPIVRCDLAVSDAYRYVQEEPLSCPVYVFHGVDDPLVCIEEAAAWRIHTQSEFQITPLPGRHFFNSTAQQQILMSISEELAGLHSARQGAVGA